MDQKPYFRLETRGWISWSEVERYLSNDVVEIPWKWELDPVAPHRRDVCSFVPHRSTTRLGCFRLRLRSRFRIRRARFRHGLGLRYRRGRARRCLWRGL